MVKSFASCTPFENHKLKLAKLAWEEKRFETENFSVLALI